MLIDRHWTLIRWLIRSVDSYHPAQEIRVRVPFIGPAGGSSRMGETRGARNGGKGARLRHFSITGTRAQGYSINGGYRALAASTFITQTSSASAFPDFHPGDDDVSRNIRWRAVFKEELKKELR